MFGVDDLILGGLAFGGKLLSGLGAQQSASHANKRAANLQAWADEQNHALGEQIKKVSAPSQIPVDAAAAGFNPVTWLGAMGSSYGALWQQGWGLLQRHAPEQTAVPSTLSAIGGAVTAGADSLSSALETNKKLEAQQSNLATYLASVQSARAKGNPMAGIGTPAFATAGPRVGGGGAVAALSLGSGKGKAPLSPGVVEDTFKVSNPGTFSWGVNSNYPDAEAQSKRYGTVGDILGGTLNFFMDAAKRSTGPDPAKDYGFGTRFNPNAANDRVPLPFPWSSSSTGALSPNQKPYQPAPGTTDWEQAVMPPLFGW